MTTIATKLSITVGELREFLSASNADNNELIFATVSNDKGVSTTHSITAVFDTVTGIKIAILYK